MSFPARARIRFVTHGPVVRRRRYLISDTDLLRVVRSCHSRLHIRTVGLLPSAERWPRGSFSAHCRSSNIFYYALRPTRASGESRCRRYCGLHNHYLPGELRYRTLCVTGLTLQPQGRLFHFLLGFYSSWISRRCSQPSTTPRLRNCGSLCNRCVRPSHSSRIPFFQRLVFFPVSNSFLCLASLD